jgi:hypothetical protein
VDWRRMFEPQGLNWWIVLSGMGMNFVLTSFLFLGTTYGAANGLSGALYILILSAGGFSIPLLTAYVCGRMGGDRFLAYAFYPLVGFLILTVPGILSSGVFGILLVFFGVLGAFNGAQMAIRSVMKPRHTADLSLDGDTANKPTRNSGTRRSDSVRHPPSLSQKQTDDPTK